MDQHPIPQDVTGFQFKLIGTMTVKQFGYVACGVVSAVILYYLPLDSAFGVLIKLLFIPLLGASGVIVAFVPIDGRPIDVMTTNFIKALFSPNQYVYRRQGRQLSFAHISLAKPPVVQKTQQNGQPQAPTNATEALNQKEERLRALLLSSRGRVKNEVDKKEAAFLKELSIPATQSAAPLAQGPAVTRPTSIVSAKPLPTTPPVQAQPIQQKNPLPQPLMQPVAPKTPINKKDELSQKESQLEQALTEAKKEESATQTPAAHQKVAVLTKQIQEIHAQKMQLEQELAHLKTQLAQQKSPTVAPTPPQSKQPTQDPQHVRTISQNVTKKAGLPLISDTPNVVVGIVKDPRGNVLPNILVEVKDKDDNPVRAFKTNPLGQFASATPLSPGTYTIELEDPKKLNRFDKIQIIANNRVLLPIEIISHDAREDLRKQLFAN